MSTEKNQNILSNDIHVQLLAEYENEPDGLKLQVKGKEKSLFRQINYVPSSLRHC